MKRIMAVAAVALGAALVYGPSTAADAEKADGKTLFTSNKCQTCHSVDVAEIKRTKPVSATAARKPPDLSKVGDKRDAEWMVKFLSKTEKIEGKTHPPVFKGTKEDRETIAAWLATLKSDEAGATGATGAAKEAKEAKEAATEAKEEAKEAKEAAEQAKDAAQETKEDLKEHEKKEGSGSDHAH